MSSRWCKMLLLITFRILLRFLQLIVQLHFNKDSYRHMLKASEEKLIQTLSSKKFVQTAMVLSFIKNRRKRSVGKLHNSTGPQHTRSSRRSTNQYHLEIRYKKHSLMVLSHIVKWTRKKQPICTIRRHGIHLIKGIQLAMGSSVTT